jgi:hypothetical protein
MAGGEEPSAEGQEAAEAAAELREEDGGWSIEELEIPSEIAHRMEQIQRFLRASGSKSYGKVQQQVAKELGISVRSLQRQVKLDMERWSGEGYGSAVIEGIRPLKAKEKGKQ